MRRHCLLLLIGPLPHISFAGLAVAQTAPSASPTARPIPYPVTPPAEFQRAISRGTRTATGAPGPKYWQQWATYKLTAKLVEERKALEGNGRIVYYNRSADTLRSEEHTSELQSRQYLVCRLLLE